MTSFHGPAAFRSRALVALAASVPLVAAAVLLPASAQAATHDAPKPSVRLPQSCSTIVPAVTRRAVYGRSLTLTHVVNDDYRPEQAYSPIKGALSEAGWRDCLWHGSSGDLEVSALPDATAQYKTAIKRYDVPGAVRTAHSVSYCTAEGDEWSCDLDVLVGATWVEAHLSGSDGRTSASDYPERYPHAIRLAVQHAFAAKPKGARWHLPATAWTTPSSCLALDPKDRVSAAAGLPGDQVDYGDIGTAPLTGFAAVQREHALACSWIDGDGTSELAAYIAPGATWAHPKGSTIAPATIGKHVERARWHRAGGRLILDVVAKGGWLQVVSKQSLAHSEAAARQLLKLLD